MTLVVRSSGESDFGEIIPVDGPQPARDCRRTNRATARRERHQSWQTNWARRLDVMSQAQKLNQLQWHAQRSAEVNSLTSPSPALDVADSNEGAPDDFIWRRLERCSATPGVRPMTAALTDPSAPRATSLECPVVNRKSQPRIHRRLRAIRHDVVATDALELSGAHDSAGV